MQKDKSKKSRTFFITAGGTGGHMFPALSLYKELRARGHVVYFFTDSRGDKFIKNEQIPLKYVFDLGERKKLWKFIPKLFYYYIKSRSAVSSFKPNAAIGFGGYPSFPIMLAGSHKKVATILHEQNAVLGKANGILAYSFFSQGVDLICTSWPTTEKIEEFSNEIPVGLPFRPEILELRNLTYKPNESAFKILVLGGSLGAKALDDIIHDAVKNLKPAQRKNVELVIQSSSAELGAKYKKLGIPAKIQSFFDDLQEILTDIDLVICRAGASTLMEMQLASKPLIAIPLPNSADNHQLKNAQLIEKNGSGEIVEQNMRASKLLTERLSFFINTPDKLKEMSDECADLSIDTAHENLANVVEDIATIAERVEKSKEEAEAEDKKE